MNEWFWFYEEVNFRRYFLNDMKKENRKEAGGKKGEPTCGILSVAAPFVGWLGFFMIRGQNTGVDERFEGLFFGLIFLVGTLCVGLLLGVISRFRKEECKGWAYFGVGASLLGGLVLVFLFFGFLDEVL